MAVQVINENDAALKAVLHLIDQDIDQLMIIPADAEYFARLCCLVDGVTIDLDQRLPNEDLSL
ncbi:MAG: hypothetical protein ACREO1_14670 [Arenimonas sp.]